MHLVGRFDESRLAPGGLKYQNHCKDYSIAPLIDHTSGSAHTELMVNRLAAQGTIKAGTANAWRNAGSEPQRWLQRAASQPRISGDVKDTLFLKDNRIPTEGKSPDLKNLKGSMLGHFDMSQIPPRAERQDVLKGLEGVFLNWRIDSKFGASHHRMAFIEYQPGVGIDRMTTPLKKVILFFRVRSKEFATASRIWQKQETSFGPASDACTRVKTGTQNPYDGLKRSRLGQLRKMHFDSWRSGGSVQWRLKVS